MTCFFAREGEDHTVSSSVGSVHIGQESSFQKEFLSHWVTWKWGRGSNRPRAGSRYWGPGEHECPLPRLHSLSWPTRFLHVPPDFSPFGDIAAHLLREPTSLGSAGRALTPTGRASGGVSGREGEKHTHPALRILLISQKPAFWGGLKAAEKMKRITI